MIPSVIDTNKAIGKGSMLVEKNDLLGRELSAASYISSFPCEDEGSIATYLQVGPAIYSKRKGNGFGSGKSALALSTDGDVKTLLVGAPFEGDGGDDADGYGKVYVYEWESSDSQQWIPMVEISGESTSSKRFGSLVAISNDGSTIAIAAEDSNEVRIYRRHHTSESDWIQLGDTFSGISGALSSNGSIVAILTYGAARVFQWDTLGNEWIQFGIDIPEGGFQVAVSDNGSTVVLGNWFPLGGYMKIYHWYPLGGYWYREANIEGIDNDACGQSVDLSVDGSIAAMHCIGNHIGRGIVQVYERTGTFDESNSWFQVGNNITGYFQYFSGGLDLSNDGSVIAIGGSNFEQAIVYRRNYFDDWVPVETNVQEAKDDNMFGHTVSISGDASMLVIASYPFDYSGTGFSETIGIVRTYTLGCADQWYYTTNPPVSPTKESSNKPTDAEVAIYSAIGGIFFLMIVCFAKSRIDRKKEKIERQKPKVIPYGFVPFHGNSTTASCTSNIGAGN